MSVLWHYVRSFLVICDFTYNVRKVIKKRAEYVTTQNERYNGNTIENYNIRNAAVLNEINKPLFVILLLFFSFSNVKSYLFF